MVFFALKERLKLDEDSRTRYEAAKSLILLGELVFNGQCDQSLDNDCALTVSVVADIKCYCYIMIYFA